jgi:hypothetical protein
MMSNYDTCPVCGRVTVGWSAAMDHRISEITANSHRYFSAAKLARAKESRWRR